MRTDTRNIVATISGVTHQSMRQIVDRLEEKGLIEVIPDKKDKRAVRLVRTNAAEEIGARDAKPAVIKAAAQIKMRYPVSDCILQSLCPSAVRLVRTNAAEEIGARDTERNYGFVFELFSCLVSLMPLSIIACKRFAQIKIFT